MSSFCPYLVILGQIFHVDPVNEDEQKVWGCHEVPCELKQWLYGLRALFYFFVTLKPK